MTPLPQPEGSSHLSFWQHLRLVPLFTTILGAILFLFALCIGLASYYLIQSNQSLKDVTEEIQVRMAISNSSNHLRTARLNIIHAGAAVRIGDMDLFNENLKQAEKRIQLAGENFKAYTQRRIKTPADEALDGELTTRFTAYVSEGLLPMVKSAKDGSFENVITRETDFTRGLDNDYNAVLLKAIAIRTQRATAINAGAEAQTRMGFIMMAGAFAAALLLTLATFIFLRRVIIAPLRQAVQRIERISHGDLTAPPQAWGRSEIGALGSNLQTMQQALVKTVGTVREGAVAIYQGSTEISAGNTDLSSRTEQQAAALEETAASMEQLTATVKQNAENAHHASQLAGDASGKARQGGDIVSGVIGTMNNISASSKKIAEITTVINSIAFQTNILALNAAVEAARAGSEGRGFAVVAAEVRALAQRSAKAAQDVRILIDRSVNSIGQGNELVQGAGTTMEEIILRIRQVSELIENVSAASNEQSVGIDQVNLAVTHMDAATQQNAALSQQSTAAAQALQAQAETLLASVSVFKLNPALAQL